eukprot:6144730-Amphidinium_carterae.1
MQRTSEYPKRRTQSLKSAADASKSDREVVLPAVKQLYSVQYCSCQAALKAVAVRVGLVHVVFY